MRPRQLSKRKRACWGARARWRACVKVCVIGWQVGVGSGVDNRKGQGKHRDKNDGQQMAHFITWGIVWRKMHVRVCV